MLTNPIPNVTSVQVFNNTQFGEIRVADERFCLNDVCKILGLTHVTETKKRLSKKGCSSIAVLTAGGSQSMLFIDEPNLYRCIFQSRKPNAEKFQDWVCEDILPAIRRTGGYIASAPDETPEQIMARALIVAQETIKRTEDHARMLSEQNELQKQQLQQSAPKVQYFDSVLQSSKTYTMTQVAKELEMSAVALENKLQNMGIIFRQSGQFMLYAKYTGNGYMKSRTHHFTRSDGSPGTNTISVWTEKGRRFVHELF
jgi:prophage antirepressor-like protein